MFNFGRHALVPAALVLCAAVPVAIAQVQIIGGLGNFDVHNNCGHECNEFEIEIEGPHPEDVYYCYHNPNYGAPKIESLPGDIGIRVRYLNPKHATAPTAIEHFGVSLRNMNLITAKRFTWVPGGVNPPPPPPPMALPDITTELVDIGGMQVAVITVKNNDAYGRGMWVQRKTVEVEGEVALETLMPNDPLIESSTEIDVETEYLPAGASLVEEEDVPAMGDRESKIMSFDVYEDLVGAFGSHTQGGLLGTMLNAAVLNSPPCPEEYGPTITLQPTDVVMPEGEDAYMFADAVGPEIGGDVVFKWYHEGTLLPREDNARLEVTPVTAESVGSYYCVISNDCGEARTFSARLSLGERCRADFDEDGFLDFHDFDDFVKAFERGRAVSDFNADGFLDFTDFDDFIGAFEHGC